MSIVMGDLPAMNQSITVRHILAPVDLGEGSKSALKYVRFLATSSGARVTVFYAHALDDESGERELDFEEIRTLEASVREYVGAFFDGIPYDVIVDAADPAVSVPRRARELGADLIVMGTLGRSRAERAIAGAFA